MSLFARKLIFFGQRPNTGQRINRRKTYTVNTGTKITALFLVRKITFCPWLEKTPPVCGWKNYFLSLVGKITFCPWFEKLLSVPGWKNYFLSVVGGSTPHRHWRRNFRSRLGKGGGSGQRADDQYIANQLICSQIAVGERQYRCEWKHIKP
jgi:hypothetical protein